MSEQQQSAGYVRPAIQALVVLLGLSALTYTLITGASLLLGIVVAAGCWLAVSLDRLKLTGANIRRVEDTAVAGLGVLLLLYGLFTSKLLPAVGVVSLLWIGLNVARIERSIRAVDADDTAIIDDADR